MPQKSFLTYSSHVDPEGAKHTKVFINGSNFEEVEKVVAATQKAMKSAPWGNSIIVDPRGGYSTAAAAVAKTFGASMEKGFGSLEGKKVTVLAGTGPVGQTAARIYAAEKARRNNHQPQPRKRPSCRRQNQR